MSQSAEPRPQDPLAWWREARFGMFIHWGLYALPAGIWKGEPVQGLGEWIMRNGQIPIAEYEALAKGFDPVRFDANAWVALAAAAGMKYIVITAKHHDGFAMYHSPSNRYNIVDATPFGRDPMKDLAEACAWHGLKLCFYYSQAQDWHAPGGAGHWEEAHGESWTKQTVEPKAFARYLDEKVKPQVTELLTQYGPIGLIWFDTPVVITKEQSEMLRDLVHGIQPNCLVSGRVGHDVGDYSSLGDNQIPRCPVSGAWETPATLNDTWGYRSDDHNWKSLGDLLQLLIDLASKGVNYLLNVGPTAEGEIPKPSVDLLQSIGMWLAVNGEAIYGTAPCPFPYEFEWGRMTTKGQRLFLMCTQWPETLTLSGLRNRVEKAYLLDDISIHVPFRQSYDPVLDHHSLALTLPEAPDDNVSVICVEFAEGLDVDTRPVQQGSGMVDVAAYIGAPEGSGTETLGISRNGVVTGWTSLEASIYWRFKLLQPGTYRVGVVLGPNQYSRARAGCRVAVEVGDQRVEGTLHCDEPLPSPRAQYFPEYVTWLGPLTLSEAGDLDMQLTPLEIPETCPDGLTLAAVRLVPVE